MARFFSLLDSNIKERVSELLAGAGPFLLFPISSSSLLLRLATATTYATMDGQKDRRSPVGSGKGVVNFNSRPWRFRKRDISIPYDKGTEERI